MSTTEYDLTLDGIRCPHCDSEGYDVEVTVNAGSVEWIFGCDDCGEPITAQVEVSVR